MTPDNLTSAFQTLAVENGPSIFVGAIPLTLIGVLRNLERTLNDDTNSALTGHERIALQVLMDEDPMTYASAFLKAAVMCMSAVSKDRSMRPGYRRRAMVLCERYLAMREGDEWMLNQSAKVARAKLSSAAAAINAGFLPQCQIMAPDQAERYFIQAFSRRRRRRRVMGRRR